MNYLVIPRQPITLGIGGPDPCPDDAGGSCPNLIGGGTDPCSSNCRPYGCDLSGCSDKYL